MQGVMILSKEAGYKFFLSSLSALLLTVAFPPYDMEVLAWIAIVPLFYLIMYTTTYRAVFLWGWFSGILFYLFTIYWVTIAMHTYGGMPEWLSLLVLLLLSTYLGLYTGIFGLIISYICKIFKPPYLILFAPSLWVTLEYIRAHILTGFPWASMGYSQYRILPFIQISDITGYLGVSFLVIGINTLIFIISSNRKASFRKIVFTWPVIVFLIIILSSLAYGYIRLHTVFYDVSRPLKIAVLQGNITQDLKWNPTFRRKTIKIYEDLSIKAGIAHPDLIIWPEAATPFFLQDKTAYRQEILNLVNKEGTYFLIGSPSYIPMNNDIKLHNSAYLLSPDKGIIARYDKIHLVPFGEYVPLARILFFVKKLVVDLGDFIPGNDFTIMNVPDAKFGVAICYEVIFPELVRKFVKKGAQFMTTITNDAWFGNTRAPYQHFSMIVFRSIENRIFFARSANTGISGFIAPSGRILKESHIFTRTFLTGKIYPSTEKTFYTRYGDIFAYLCLGFTGLVLLTSIGRRGII